MNPRNVDPWVYEFSSDVLKGIQHDKDASGDSLSQVSKKDINQSNFIQKNVNSAQNKVDIAKNKYIDNEVHTFTEPLVDQLPESRKDEKKPKEGNKIPGWGGLHQ